MSRKSDIKICRYRQCKHTTKNIDISCDDYVVQGSMYFHKDCYDKKMSDEVKIEQTKADLQLIKNLWIEHISKTVNYGELFKVLNEFLSRGVGSDYLVFTMLYIIKHKMNLNYPGGFRYFADKQEIREAYKKKTLRKSLEGADFSVSSDSANAPSFSIKQSKSEGFESILRGGK